MFHPLLYRFFQGRIDDAFRKSDADRSVPWPATPIPFWANGLQPRTILDLGCARGRFTTAVLSRLHSWGCLGRLGSLALVEEEQGFDSHDATAERNLTAECRGAAGGAETLDIQLVNGHAAVFETNHGRVELAMGNEILRPPDLILASHVTYYFEDDGASLIRALTGWLPSESYAWIVVRKRECPIYRKRLGVLVASAASESEKGYAEDIEPIILRSTGLELVDRRDRDFLAQSNRPDDCASLAHLLMWRVPIEDGDPAQAAAAREVCRDQAPLFSERHFIVRRL